MLPLESNEGNRRFPLTEEGYLLEVGETGTSVYDFNVPFAFNPIRFEDETEVISTKTRRPDANLEKIYEEIKEFPVSTPYISGPNEIRNMELPQKFGEILTNWKNSSKE